MTSPLQRKVASDFITPNARNLAGPGAQDKMRQLMRVAGMLPVLLLLCVGFSLMSDSFFSAQNFSIISQQASINVVLASGLTFVILTGGIDLSVGSILAVSAVVALLVSQVPGLASLAIPAGLGIGLLLGLVNGVLVAFGKLPAFIVTLGGLTAMRGIARLIGEDKTVFNPDLSFAYIGNDTLFGVPWLVVIALVVVLFRGLFFDGRF